MCVKVIRRDQATTQWISTPIIRQRSQEHGNTKYSTKDKVLRLTAGTLWLFYFSSSTYKSRWRRQMP